MIYEKGMWIGLIEGESATDGNRPVTIYSTDNGDTWETGSEVFIKAYRKYTNIVYNADLDLFTISGTSGVQIAESKDGINWVQLDSPEPENRIDTLLYDDTHKLYIGLGERRCGYSTYATNAIQTKLVFDNANVYDSSNDAQVFGTTFDQAFKMEIS